MYTESPGLHDLQERPTPAYSKPRSVSPHNGRACLATRLPSISGPEPESPDPESTTSVTNALDQPGRRDDVIAGSDTMDALMTSHPLPALTGAAWWRKWQYVYCSTYRILCTGLIVSNCAIIIAMVVRLSKHHLGFSYEAAAEACGANLLVGSLVRQEHVINSLFRLACSLPHRTPLCIRRRAAKIYSYGGVHSGCGISAMLWYIFYTALIVKQFKGTEAVSIVLGVTIATTLVLFCVMVTISHPSIRKRWHDRWEMSHRFGGWTAVALVWTQTLVLVVAKAKRTNQSIARALPTTPTFWFLIIITACLIYPWLRLRRRTVHAQKLSDHAVRLWYGDRSLPAASGYRLSDRPLVEWHGFATIPNMDGQPGYSIVVSNAGDWTRSLIDNPPTHIWTRGAPTFGVIKVASLFRPIIVVATGSGVGPALSFLQVYPDHAMHIIWSARSPEATYGKSIMDAVLRADPKALIIDTKQTGHPDLSGLTYALYTATGAEAMLIISNPVVTRKVVFEMEARGVPAFGAIFDS